MDDTLWGYEASSNFNWEVAGRVRGWGGTKFEMPVQLVK